MKVTLHRYASSAFQKLLKNKENFNFESEYLYVYGYIKIFPSKKSTFYIYFWPLFSGYFSNACPHEWNKDNIVPVPSTRVGSSNTYKFLS